MIKDVATKATINYLYDNHEIPKAERDAGIKERSDEDVQIVKLLKHWKRVLDQHPTEENASKALADLDLIDSISDEIYNYTEDGIDDAQLAMDNINDLLDGDDDPDDKEHDENTKRFIKEHDDYFFYGGSFEPVDATLVKRFIDSEIERYQNEYKEN